MAVPLVERHFRVPATRPILESGRVACPSGVAAMERQALGYTREEILRLNGADVVVPDERPRVEPELHEVAAGSAAGEGNRVSFWIPDDGTARTSDG